MDLTSSPGGSPQAFIQAFAKSSLIKDTLERSMKIDREIHDETKRLHQNVSHLLAEFPVTVHPKVELSLPDHSSSQTKSVKIALPNLLSLVDKNHVKEAE
jgi:hypothetical protein